MFFHIRGNVIVGESREETIGVTEDILSKHGAQLPAVLRRREFTKSQCKILQKSNVRFSFSNTLH